MGFPYCLTLFLTVIDSELRFKNHVKKVLSKELRAALALKRMYIIILNIA